MNLKKNDKIILIVGVVILIVAGVGIALYSAPGNGDGDVGQPSEKTHSFTYTWEQQTDEIVIGDSLYAGENSPYDESFSVMSNTNTVLTNVDLNLVWRDDSTYGLIFERGVDTLSAEFSLGDDVKSESSKGRGNFTFFFNVNGRPDPGTVEAEDVGKAKAMINEDFDDMNEASFDVKVTVNTGERIWHILHLLKVLRDNGNNFELTATYTYYEYTLEEPNDSDNGGSNGGDDTKESGDGGSNHNIGEFYVNLGYGRGMI